MFAVTFQEFKNQCETKGYTKFEENKNYYAMWTSNAVKTEVKNKVYTTGFGRTSEELSILSQEIKNAGFEIKKENKGYINILLKKDVMKGFFELVDIIESLDSIKYKSDGRKAFSGINEDGLFTNIATVIKTASDVKMYSMINRDIFDQVDHIIALNKPLDKNSYREHIVPCTMIIQEAFRMFSEGASISEVAVMIQQNLFIVHITSDEAYYIDSILGYKTTMPEGWKFGDNVFARLDAAKIICK